MRKRSNFHHFFNKIHFICQRATIYKYNIYIQYIHTIYTYNFKKGQRWTNKTYIYCHERKKPLKDDWIHLVERDNKDNNINISDKQIEAFSRYEFKKLFKYKVRSSLFVELELVKRAGTLKGEKYYPQRNKIPQNYLIDLKFSNKETSLLFNMRSQWVNEFRNNFYISQCQFCKSC